MYRGSKNKVKLYAARYKYDGHIFSRPFQTDDNIHCYIFSEITSGFPYKSKDLKSY